MTETRRIRLPHLYNFRDLGGYEADGFVTAWRRLFRGDCPADLDDDEWEKMKSLGIRHIIDLRSTYEVADNPVNTPDGITYHHCHFLKEDDSIEDKDLASRKFLESLSLDYSFMMKNSLSELAGILKVTVDCLTDGNVYFFCTAGKDRTGMLAAVCLYLSGVGKEDIIADYCVTEVYNADVIMKRLDSLPADIRAQISPESMELAAASKAETMEHLLNWMEENDFPALMEKYGFDANGIKTLREQLR